MPAPRRTAVLGATAAAAALAVAGAVALPSGPAEHVTVSKAAAAVGTGDTAPLSGVSFTLKSTPVSAAALKQLDDTAANPAHGMKRQANLVAAASGAKNGLVWKSGCGANDAVKAMNAKLTVGAWCFANGDKSSKYWIPQGVATSRTAQLDGFVLSWYHRHLSGSDWVTDGSRLTVGKRPLVEKAGAYQPVTLAIPTATAAGKLAVKDVRPAAPAPGAASAQGVADAPQHQGGVALAGDYVYTADTSGLRVYDVRRTYQVPTGKTGLGVDANDGKFYAHGEKYVLFQTGMYRPLNAGACPAWDKAPSAKNKDLCFSTVTYDPTTSPKSLLTAEYKTKGGVTSAKPMRVVRWPLNADGSLQADASGQVESMVVYGTNLTNVQGVAGYHGGGGDTIYYSTTLTAPGAFYSDRNGDGKAPFKIVGPIGGESLAFDPYSGGDRIYGITERPDQRMFFWTYRKQLQRPGMP